MPERQPEDVLSLAEAASYLRVSEEEVLRLAEERNIPAQRIGGEWRFLKRALDHWLTYGPLFIREYRDFPPWSLEHPMMEELLLAIEKRLLQRIAPVKPERGSKKAVGRHVGVFVGEGDEEEVLAGLAAMRGEGGG